MISIVFHSHRKFLGSDETQAENRIFVVGGVALINTVPQ
jgi:hypothetical protein